MRPITKTLVGVVTVLSGAFTPIIPTELSPGLSEYPAMRWYQFEAGSDRTDWRLEDGVVVDHGPLPAADAPAGGSESTTTSFMKIQEDVTIGGDIQLSY